MPAISKKIDDYLQYLIVEKGSSPLTLRNYKHYLKRFSNWYGENYKKDDITSIRPDVVAKYRLYLAKLPDGRGGTLSRKTQGFHAIALRSFLKWLAKKDYNVMAADKIDLPKTKDRQVKFLTGDQVDRILNAPTLSTINGKRDKAILEILFSTGVRVSELVSLNRDKIDLKRREFAIVGKGEKPRVVFVSKRAADWLEIYLSARKDKYNPVFIRHKGKVDPTTTDDEMRLSVRSVQRLVKKYARKVKITVDVTPHVLRHSFATDLLVAGADIRSVQEMLGHKNIATTQIYTHVTNKHLKDVHEAFHGKGK